MVKCTEFTTSWVQPNPKETSFASNPVCQKTSHKSLRHALPFTICKGLVQLLIWLLSKSFHLRHNINENSLNLVQARVFFVRLALDMRSLFCATSFILKSCPLCVLIYWVLKVEPVTKIYPSQRQIVASYSTSKHLCILSNSAKSSYKKGIRRILGSKVLAGVMGCQYIFAKLFSFFFFAQRAHTSHLYKISIDGYP